MTKKQKNFLLITILLVSLIQMPGQATSPAINKIHTDVFPTLPLSLIQTTFSITSLCAALGAFIPATLIRRGLVSKRGIVATGMFMFGLAAILISLMNTQYWQFVLVAVLVGFAAAMFISPMISVMVDNFHGEEGRRAAGLQSAANGIGGVALSVLGGHLVNFRWYGGYLLLLAGIPIGILVLLSFPKGKLPRIRRSEESASSVTRTRLHSDVYYYTFFAMMAMFMFIVCVSNISVHLSRSGVDNYTVYAGYATALMMGGTFVAGLLFKKLNSRLGDTMMSLSFIMVFIGYMLISTFDTSIPAIFVGVFLAGSCLGIMTPQCIHSVSKVVDESNSATATALLTAVAPGLGAFLSPVIMTNLTTALGGDSTVYRFRFAAIVGICLAVIVGLLNLYRSKRRSTKAGGAEI
ncbi:MAG: MFS transporter [Oscillospiraceae bacterium]|nr:MFS transporter [Oscillospiraceae bacterium]